MRNFSPLIRVPFCRVLIFVWKGIPGERKNIERQQLFSNQKCLRQLNFFLVVTIQKQLEVSKRPWDQFLWIKRALV